MAKSRNGAKKAKRVLKPKVPRNLGVLDAGGAAWARLLADPCNAPLTAPCYPSGSMGGQLVRIESDFIIGEQETAAGGAMLYTPGLFAYSTQSAAYWPLSYLISTSDVSTHNWAPSGNVPGATQYASWSKVRAVACCAQIIWPGSELNRQGVVGFGQVDSGLIFTTGLTTAQLRQLCPRVDRMPADIAEVKWRPGDSDAEGSHGDSGTTGAVNGKGSLLITWAGIPPSTGVRIRIVTILEVTAKANSGMVLAPGSNNPSKHTASQVLEVLDRTGHWFYEAGAFIAKAYDVGANLYKTAQAYGRVATRAVPLLM